MSRDSREPTGALARQWVHSDRRTSEPWSGAFTPVELAAAMRWAGFYLREPLGTLARVRRGPGDAEREYQAFQQCGRCSWAIRVNTREAVESAGRVWAAIYRHCVEHRDAIDAGREADS